MMREVTVVVVAMMEGRGQGREEGIAGRQAGRQAHGRSWLQSGSVS